MVLNNIQLIGHNGAASFWGKSEGTAFAEGYITPADAINHILWFAIPIVLRSACKSRRYNPMDMLPGIFGYWI